MNKKLFIIFTLAFVSFINNLICNFDYLIDLMMSFPVEFYLFKTSNNLTIKEYLIVLYSLICYFTFFINKNPLSVLRV